MTRPALRLVRPAQTDSPYLGTRLTADRALVPYGEFIEGPWRQCHFCPKWFSYLGRPRHEAKCPTNPANRRKKGRK